MQEQPPGPSPIDDMRGAANILMIAADCYAFFAEMLLHFRFGSRYFDLRSIGVIGLIMLHVLFWNGKHEHDMLICLVVFIGLVILHRLHMGIRFLRGSLDDEHSRYCGYPWAMFLNRTMEERDCKLWFEPIMLVIVAVLLDPLHEPIGSWLLLCGIGLFVSNGGHHWAERQRKLDLRDQMMTAQRRNEQQRSLRW